MSRVVMFVFNDVRMDTRVLREAGSLAAAGHEVTIIARPADPASTVGEREERDGFTIIRVPIPLHWRRRWLFLRARWVFLRAPWRFRGELRDWVSTHLRRGPIGWAPLAAVIVGGFILIPVFAIIAAVLLVVRRIPGLGGGSGGIDWLARWRFSILAWAHAAAMAAPIADIYHGHDLTGLAAAVAAADRHNGATVVYDSHEIYLESGATAEQPGWLRRFMARNERRWIGRAAALVTVNESLAAELGRRYAPRRTVVVHNCPPRSDDPSGHEVETSNPIRAATGIPDDEPIALYHGAFSRHRGLEELARAVAEPGLERVHAVFLGYGGLRAELDALAAGPIAPGRIHILAAVPPDELGAWVASADVGVMAIQPSTINHRLSTPNKLFECLAAGVPVVASDFPEMRAIVCDNPGGPLGLVAAPDDVSALARAILAITDATPAERSELRARCLRAAHERWNWETESAGLVDLYAGFAAKAALP